MSNKHIDRFADVPVNRLLEYTLISRSSEGAVVSMEAKPAYAQETGVVQGGLLSAIADTAAVYAFLPDLDDDQAMTSVEFKVNFLRPVETESKPIVARSKVLKRGRTIGVCEVQVTQAERLMVKGIFTYMFLPKKNH